MPTLADAKTALLTVEAVWREVDVTPYDLVPAIRILHEVLTSVCPHTSYSEGRCLVCGVKEQTNGQ